MAKTAIVAADAENQSKVGAAFSGATGLWQRGRIFLSDVRSEMRKVVTPARKEVQATTTVVLVTVFVFAAYFAAVDFVFSRGLTAVISKLTGQQ
jgi:preprotein translocase subunit SecE